MKIAGLIGLYALISVIGCDIAIRYSLEANPPLIGLISAILTPFAHKIIEEIKQQDKLKIKLLKFQRKKRK